MSDSAVTSSVLLRPEAGKGEASPAALVIVAVATGAATTEEEEEEATTLAAAPDIPLMYSGSWNSCLPSLLGLKTKNTESSLPASMLRRHTESPSCCCDCGCECPVAAAAATALDCGCCCCPACWLRGEVPLPLAFFLLLLLADVAWLTTSSVDGKNLLCSEGSAAVIGRVPKQIAEEESHRK